MFPRRKLTFFSVLTAFAGLLVVGLPLVGLAQIGGSRLLKQGGATMTGLLVASAVGSVLLAGLGMVGVRGRRGFLGAMVVLPSAIPVITILGIGVATTLMGAAVMDESIVPADRLRILAKGTSELDALYIYGAYVGAAAFGAAAVALLSASASVDGTSGGWRPTIIVGMAGVAVHLAFRGHVVVTAALVLVTALASLAARNSAYVRAAPDFVEARGWLADVLSAAVSSATGIVLFDFATMMLTERRALEAVADEVDVPQKLAILVQLASDRRAALIGMTVDGVLCVGIVALAFFAARAPDRRSPRPVLAGLALASTLFTVGLLVISRRQVTTAVELAAHSSEDVRARLPGEPAGTYAHGESPVVMIDLHPNPLLTMRSLSWFDRELGIYADGETPWPRVLAAVAKQMRERNHWMPDRGTDTSPPDLSIRVRPRQSTEQGLGFYAVFLASTGPLLRIKLAYYGLEERPDVFRDIPDSATLNDVVAEYTRRPVGFTVELPKDF